MVGMVDAMIISMIYTPTIITRLGRANWTLVAWAIGIPLPIVAVIALMRGCS